MSDTQQDNVHALGVWLKKPPPRCFLSYSTKYEDLAERLHADLVAEGIKCWKWDHDCTGGQHLWDEIERALPHHLPVLLICGKHSLVSRPVQRELRLALSAARSSRGRPCISLLIDHYLFDGWRPRGDLRYVKDKLIGIMGIRAYDCRKDERAYRLLRERLADVLRQIHHS